MDTSEDSNNATSNLNSNTNNNGTASATSTANSNSVNPNDEVDANTIKRRAIQSIMRNTSLDERTKRMQIQQLMSGQSSQQHQQQQHNSMNTLIDPNGTSVIANTSISLSNLQIGSACSSATINNEIGNNSNNSNTVMEVMKCVHYERQCNIVAPCCGQIFGCRLCHDEKISDHQLDRYGIREVVCKECNTRQPTSNKCRTCNVRFGEYHCSICNLWMSLEKIPFHCEHCNLCRVGGSENYIHCHGCNMCISQNAFESHVCLKDKFKNSCPICREDMHTSRHASLDLPCGHAIHTHCFRKLAAFDYRCPICKKTVVSPQNMARAWEDRAREIQSQPMPPDLARVVDIWCNDCEKRSSRCNWHFLGVQCPACRSFNTAVENHR